MREEVLRLSREKLGADHPATLNAMQNLAGSYRDAGRLEEALGMEEEVLRLSREKLEPEHPETVIAMGDLACTLKGIGRVPEALALLRKVSVESLDFIPDVRFHLACYECLSGNLEEAKHLITEEIAADPEKKDYALHHPDLTALRNFIQSL